ncbi:hypothetical protein RJ639_037330 [Escallonia herrerae]|uniref:Pentatricopeptide repeat-containing protein n=1 Tax=Escallonia herrerae TaxID=1293975 RepID=A0AA88WNV4_9ASTE|nr:hypothetical protein RJ639_037330 [Escallonia herrerae]
MQVTSAQMDVTSFDRSGILASNYSRNISFASGFSISRRPKKVKQIQVLGSRTCRCSVILKGESDFPVADGGIIRRESEFKPSFDEYLKAMESVKSGREKKQADSPTRSSSDNGEQSDFKLSKLLEQDISFRNTGSIDFERGNEGNSGRPDGLVRNGSKRDRTLKRNVGLDKREWSDKQTGGVKEIKGSGESKGHAFRSDVRRLRSSDMKGRREEDQRQSIRIYNKRDAQEDVKLSRISKPRLEDSSDGEWENERAAFKSMEDYNDVNGRPRISRLDMEERIQKLAKCLNGADIDMPEWMFSKMMRSAKIRFADHSILRVIQILGKLGNWRRVLQVIEWIQSRERFKSHKIRYIYTAVLDALGKARRPVEALNVFHAMQQSMSSYPDYVAYRCIAVTLGQAGHMRELFDVIDCMRSPPKKKLKTGVLEKWDPRLEPDIVVYNAVLNACIRRKNWEGAFWVLQQIKQRGQQPSSATYGLVMEVMFVCGKYNLVHEFFKKVQKSSIPNALTYKVLVNTHWREGKVDEAVTAVRDMERRGIIGSGSLYYDLARCLCSAGRCQEALMQVVRHEHDDGFVDGDGEKNDAVADWHFFQQIDKICMVANKPLVVTYTGLIQACLDAGNIESGVYIFNHMHKVCSPNLVTCNILMKAYLEHDMLDEAKELFMRLAENGSHISSKLEYNGRVMPDIYTFNLMLDACASHQRWDDLECVYEKMLQHGFHFNTKRHLRLILDACRAGKAELLETTWKHLVQVDQPPPPLLTKEMFRVKLEQDDYAAAFSCIARHPSDYSPVFSRKAWLSFFRENAHRFQKETLVRLINEVSVLIAGSDYPNIIFQNLTISCKKILNTQIQATENFQSRQLAD